MDIAVPDGVGAEAEGASPLEGVAVVCAVLDAETRNDEIPSENCKLMD